MPSIFSERGDKKEKSGCGTEKPANMNELNTLLSIRRMSDTGGYRKIRAQLATLEPREKQTGLWRLTRCLGLGDLCGLCSSVL